MISMKTDDFLGPYWFWLLVLFALAASYRGVRANWRQRPRSKGSHRHR
jgi:hypothetical protein